MNKKLLIVIITIIIIVCVFIFILFSKNKSEGNLETNSDQNLITTNNPNTISPPPPTGSPDYNLPPEIIIDSNIIFPSEGNELSDSTNNQQQDNRGKGQTKVAILGATCGSKNKDVISESVEVPGQMLVCKDMAPAVPRYVWQLQ